MVLGEVGGPGVQLIFADQVSVLETISRAGGIKPEGNRNNIVLIRQQDDGTKKTFYFDMNDPKIIESEYFYVYPNDLIYVRSIKLVKAVKANAAILGLWISTGTLLLLVYNLLKGGGL